MSSYSILTSISQYGAEDNLLFSDGKSQREMILMIIMSDNNRHGTSKGTDTVEQSDSSIFYNTKRNAYFQEKKILNKFLLYSFEQCKAMCPSIHHGFWPVNPITLKFAFFSQQRVSILKGSMNCVQVNTQQRFFDHLP